MGIACLPAVVIAKDIVPTSWGRSLLGLCKACLPSFITDYYWFGSGLDKEDTCLQANLECSFQALVQVEAVACEQDCVIIQDTFEDVPEIYK